jgi:uncharacterized protein (TIGR02391 family)
MILFPEDVQAINDLLSQRADFDPELLQACQDHINHGQYADAVFKAFRVLEGRVQQCSGIQGESASRTLSLALTPRGPLTQKLGLTTKQAANLGELLKGAFFVFRNPEAHPEEAIIEYGSAECQAVLGFVNLMLGILERQPDAPLDRALKQLRRTIGTDATQRLGSFLDRVLALNVSLVERKTIFSFRALAWRATSEHDPPGAKPTNVFALYHEAEDPCLHFPLVHQWRPIVGFDAESYAARLIAGDCERWPGGNDPRLDLRKHNSIATLNWLFGIVQEIVQAMEQTVGTQGHK